VNLPELAGGDSYYVPLGDGRYQSTIHAQGAWNPHEQHMAPASGLMVHELAQHDPRPELRMARLSFEILGLIPGGEFSIRCETIRPGKTIELVQAELLAPDAKGVERVAIRASAWRLIMTDTSAIAAVEDEPMPSLEECDPFDVASLWPGGYIASIDVRVARHHRRGNGCVWVSTRHPLIEGEETPEWIRLMGLVDTTNGIAAREKPGPGGYAWPNTDLQIHLYRQPSGTWLGLDNSVSFGTDGIGLTSTVLHDVHGPFGRAEQILTIRAVG